MTDRKPSSVWTWIVGALIGVPVLYVVSFGPACWWFSTRTTGLLSNVTTSRLYSPIGYVAIRGRQGWVGKVISWYATRGSIYEWVNVPLGNGDYVMLGLDEEPEVFRPKNHGASHL